MRWPHDQPHIAYSRFGVRLPSGLLLKGLAPGDALDMHREDPGAVVVRQVVVYVTGGPDEGCEVLRAWKTVTLEDGDTMGEG